MVEFYQVCVGTKLLFRGEVWTVTHAHIPHDTIIGNDRINSQVRDQENEDGLYIRICLDPKCAETNSNECELLNDSNAVTPLTDT